MMYQDLQSALISQTAENLQTIAIRVSVLFNAGSSQQKE